MSFFFYYVYVHADIQWEESSVLCLCLMSLSQSTGNASTEKKSLRFQSAVLKYQLYFLHLVHLVFPPLSSSWLVTSKQKNEYIHVIASISFSRCKSSFCVFSTPKINTASLGVRLLGRVQRSDIKKDFFISSKFVGYCTNRQDTP